MIEGRIMHGSEMQTKSGCLDRQKLFTNTRCFPVLPAEIIERLSSYAVMKDVKKRGTTIFTKGEVGNSLFAGRDWHGQDDQPSADGKDGFST